MGYRSRVRGLIPQPVRPAARRAYIKYGAMTASLRIEPSFIVIGGQRCGTTTIFKSLSDHPQILRPPVEKGTDYYTLHYSQGREWYRGHFPLKTPPSRSTKEYGQPITFEACTYYMFHPLALERLAVDFPNIKLVAMLRDPVERAYSAYKHEFARGFETESSFKQALEMEDSRLEGEIERIRRDVNYESIAHRHHAYKRRGQFAEQIERATALFPREQLHIMESESFFAEPAAEYRRLIEFLGLLPWEPPRFDQHNARPSSPMPEDARRMLEGHFAPHDEKLVQFLGHKPRWVAENGRPRVQS